MSHHRQLVESCRVRQGEPSTSRYITAGVDLRSGAAMQIGPSVGARAGAGIRNRFKPAGPGKVGGPNPYRAQAMGHQTAPGGQSRRLTFTNKINNANPPLQSDLRATMGSCVCDLRDK